MRLGISEVVNTTSIPARNEFFRAIEQVAPEVIDSLAKEVSPIYNAACAARGVIITQEQLAGKAPELRELREATLGWCRKWNLEAPWCIDFALFTMQYWRVRPNTVGKLSALPGGGPYKLPSSKPVTPELPGWEPWIESKEAYMEQAMAAIGQYCNEVLTTYEQEGWRMSPHKRGRSGDALAHFQWLVQHQVLGWSCERIAEEYSEGGLDPSAVDKALRETASLIGLSLVSLPRGRKRKTAER